MQRYTLILFALAALACNCAAEAPNYRNVQRVRFLARQQVTTATAVGGPSDAEVPVDGAVAGYPAAGITPETPFELPTETTTIRPDATYLPPDNTYGPPPPTARPTEPEPAVVYGPPHNTYGPPEPLPLPAEADVEPPQSADEDKVLVKLDDGTVIAVATSFDQVELHQGGLDESDELERAEEAESARLVYQRFPQARRRVSTTTEADVSVPIRLTQPQPQPLQFQLQQQQRQQQQLQQQRFALPLAQPAKLLLPQSFLYTTRFETW